MEVLLNVATVGNASADENVRLERSYEKPRAPIGNMLEVSSNYGTSMRQVPIALILG
jgi:hypothetical protein